ncbi:DUF2017 domain-containing protein [Actinoallomurus sp. NPDC052308]|uniref:DUF2017 domain-containing protein n=1 Tax=Actinoallomurus sp. NPDC052308 TaxID=3155530 RepID=UPI003413786E
MNTWFTRVHGGGVRLRMTREEASVVHALVTQLLDLLGGPAPGPRDDGLPNLSFSENTTVSDDPVLARLFPDAYRDNGAAAAEFRRYTEAGLRDGKRAAAQLVLDTLGDGGEILLDDEQAQVWLRSLNDLRLALGTRLGISEETLERTRSLDWNDPRTAPFAAYDWLTYLQEDLVRALW